MTDALTYRPVARDPTLPVPSWQRDAFEAKADFRRHLALALDYRRQQSVMRAMRDDWFRDSDARDFYADQAHVFGRWCLEEIATAKALRMRLRRAA